MQNPDIARLFDEVADLLEIRSENPFRVRAYRNAARIVRDHPEPVADAVRRGADLTEIAGIGTDLADKIAEIVVTGGLALHRQLAAKLPAGLLDLLRIPGLGPKRVKLLHSRLRVKSPADLAKAIDKGKVRKLPGFGAKLEEKIKAGLGLALHAERRLLLHDAEAHARALVEYVRAGGAVTDLEVAGSYRRRKETIGDLDVLVTSGNAAQVIAHFTRYPEVADVVSQGETRVTVRLRGGLQVDLRVVEPAAFGAALMYFTGSKAHNVELRGLAQDQGYKLNEYGLYKGARRAAGKTEADVYGKLGLDWIPPELREARGEVNLARAHKLPTLVTLEDVKGDLQMHTSASDGEASLPEMAEACRAQGYAYCAITDHSKRVTMANGLDPRRLRTQWKAVDRWNAENRGFTVLKSVELDILESGRLDLPNDVLAEADYVVATIHYGMNQSPERITQRLLGAVANPWVDAIGHPTGRLLGRREPYAFDFEAVAKAAAAAGCFLEINGHPERMDLPDTLAAAARRHGVRLVLSTDSHHPGNLAFMRFAVDLARRAGLEPGDVVNTLPLSALRAALRRHRTTRRD